jgi:hypothetical protein
MPCSSAVVRNPAPCSLCRTDGFSGRPATSRRGSIVQPLASQGFQFSFSTNFSLKEEGNESELMDAKKNEDGLKRSEDSRGSFRTLPVWDYIMSTLKIAVRNMTSRERKSVDVIILAESIRSMNLQ